MGVVSATLTKKQSVPMETQDIMERPHRLGVVSRLYPELTATFLTESLRNIYYGDNKKSNGFQSIDSTYFEWSVETNYLSLIHN